MEVGDAAAGGGAKVEADIETIRFERGGEQLLSPDDFGEQVGLLSGGQFVQSGNFAERHREEVAWIVRKPIEEEIGQRGPVNDERRSVVAQRGEFRKRALHRCRITRSLDIFHPPMGVKLLHGVVGGWQKRRERSPQARESQNPAGAGKPQLPEGGERLAPRSTKRLMYNWNSAGSCSPWTQG